jgi:DNA-binding response OmpR family regulator
MKILVVEDDVDLLDLLTYALRREGFGVVGALDGLQALHRWESDNPDIILLDVNLPKLDGFEVCRRIRQGSRAPPIIMLTARDEEEDIVHGLHLGADDYVTKPFSVKQLVARMRAVLRRQTDVNRQAADKLRVGDLALDLDAYEAVKGGVPVALTALEFRILFMLALNANRVIPYSRLVEYAWGYDSGDARLLANHVRRLREKLNMPLSEKHGIKAVPGVGYKLIL